MTTKSIRITKVSVLTLAEIGQLWNRGFEGYMADVSMPLPRLIGRFGWEDLSPDVSVVAWVNNDLAGFVLSGIRTIGGRRVAWNGGTGVVPEYRRHGVGRQLIAASLDAYREHGVGLATLEAIAFNTGAIALYEQMGYQTVRRVAFLRATDYQPQRWQAPAADAFLVEHGIGRQAAEVPFYDHAAPWQAQWQSGRDVESLLVREAAGNVVGYAVFQRVWDDAGQLQAIILRQCEAQPGHPAADAILRRMLREVYGDAKTKCTRTSLNLNLANQALITVMGEAGFEIATEQVCMERVMEEGAPVAEGN